jgi:hypothetical protein
MTLNLNEVLEKQVVHLANMAQKDGWLAYAKARSLELEADQTGIFAGITELVRQRIKEQE